MTIIVADLGATNARLAILEKGRVSDVYQFACDDFKNPIQLIKSFQRAYAPKAEYVLCGVPGPVKNNCVKWTNRAWTLNGQKLAKDLQLKQVILENDLKVQGTALASLTKKDYTFFQGKKTGTGPKILVNVGTGLGACYVVHDQVCAAEYGSTLLPDGKVLEMMVSATGFRKLYQSLTQETKKTSIVQIEEKYLQGDTTAKQAYQAFYQAFSKVLMNLALTIKASGGVYFCGGMLNEKMMKEMKLQQQFCNHPKMKPLLKEMPLIFIKKKNFAFLGLKALAKKYGWS